MNFINPSLASIPTTIINNPINPLSSINTSKQSKGIFVSRAQRFTDSSRPIPGPGTYDNNFKQKHTNDFQVKKEHQTVHSVARQHQWIFGSQRNSYVDKKRLSLGPGQYEHQNTLSSSPYSNWRKEERFSEPAVVANLGPGTYQDKTKVAFKSKGKQLSVFKSKGPRSFFQELVMKQKKLQQSRNPQDDQQDEDIVKFQESKYPVRRKANNLSPMFLSKCARPQLVNQQSPQKVGPGTYALQLQKNLKISTSKSFISAMHYKASPQSQNKPALMSKLTIPGPGSYNVQSRSIVQSVINNAAVHSSLPKEERFKGAFNIRESMPGPGDYNQNRFTMINQNELKLKNKGSFTRKAQKVHAFGMAPRSTMRKQGDVPFGSYDLKNYNIQYKLQKNLQHYEKLKLMDVTLPVFNSKNHK